MISHNGTSDEGGADVLIVLGAGLDGNTPSASLVSRLKVAEEYLTANPDTVAIVTGSMGPGETMTEAAAMTDWLTARGIAPERILPEDKAHDTIQNLRYSFEIVDTLELDEPSIAVLSNDFHLFRAGLIAWFEGRDVTTVSAPTPYAYLSVTYHIREYFSLLKVALTYLLA